jgi:hypothetical protein
LDPARGIVQFVVGTGGGALRPVGQVKPNSVVLRSGVYGVLKLTLEEASYRWEFLPVTGQTFTDSGSGTCH